MHGVSYFSNAKALMTTKRMEEGLRMLDKKMIAEGRKVLLFLDIAASHPNILKEGLKTYNHHICLIQPVMLAYSKTLSINTESYLFAKFSLVLTKVIGRHCNLSRMSLS